MTRHTTSLQCGHNIKKYIGSLKKDMGAWFIMLPSDVLEELH